MSGAGVNAGAAALCLALPPNYTDNMHLGSALSACNVCHLPVPHLLPLLMSFLAPPLTDS